MPNKNLPTVLKIKYRKEPCHRLEGTIFKSDFDALNKVREAYRDAYDVKPSNSILVSIAVRLLADRVEAGYLPTHPSLYIGKR